MPPKAKKTPNEGCTPPLTATMGRAAARVVQPAQRGRGRPPKTVAAAATPKEEESFPSSSHRRSQPPRPPVSRPQAPPTTSSPPSPTEETEAETDMGSARCRPLVGNRPGRKIYHPSEFRENFIPRYPVSRPRAWMGPPRRIQLFAPDLERDAPIRLPSNLPPPSSTTPPVESSSPSDETATIPVKEEEVSTPSEGRIKLREGWGYKIGETKWRAVYDPKRKSIPKLPPRGPGGYSVSMGKGGERDEPSAVFLVVNPLDDHPVPLSISDKRPRTELDYIKEKDKAAAVAVKNCYDERMAEEDFYLPCPNLGALIKIISETVEVSDDQVYIHPPCVQKAEIITTFPLDQVVHYQKKKYKEDHVVIGTSDLEEIYAIISKIRRNKRRWAKVKARAAVDEEYREKQRAKKSRAYLNEKAKLAAMTLEERRMYNRRKWDYERTKRLEKDPEQLAKKQRLEERRQANLAKNRALLAAGIDDPEERRRIQRRIRAAERTPEERTAWNRRDTEYVIKKRTRMKGMSAEELAKMEEEKRLKKEKRAALAHLTPKERMRAQQREYEARYKAKKQAREASGMKSASPSKRNVKKRRVETSEQREEENEGEMDMMDGGDGHFAYGDDGADNYEENQIAVQSISFPSPTRRSRPVPTPRHSHSYAHNNDDDVDEMAGPSTSRHHYQQRYGGHIEAEIIQLQKDVVWSDKAIHNSRVEVDRLRAEAASLESAIDEEMRVQRERKRRIAHLNAIWREDHGEDSQG